MATDEEAVFRVPCAACRATFDCRTGALCQDCGCHYCAKCYSKRKTCGYCTLALERWPPSPKIIDRRCLKECVGGKTYYDTKTYPWAKKRAKENPSMVAIGGKVWFISCYPCVAARSCDCCAACDERRTCSYVCALLVKKGGREGD